MTNHGVVTLVNEVSTRPLPLSRLEPVIGVERYDRLISIGSSLHERLGERCVWNVNSTAVGGGVAEMLQVIVGYVAGFGIPIRWTTIGGDPEFFAITKRLHNQLHGQLHGAAGGDALVGSADAHHYQEVLAANADELVTLVRPGDVVILHDPQTAGLAEAMDRAGVKVLWRCHIGIDEQNDVSRAAWEFLRPYLSMAHGYVFSRRQFAPLWVPRARMWVIPPSIDPFSAKNAELDAEDIDAILTTVGIYEGESGRRGTFPRNDGTRGEVTRAGLVIGEGRPKPGDQVVAQVSRWDMLKDMLGVMRGFADYVVPETDAYLMLVGPATTGVTDDPEGAVVFSECLAQWHELPAEARERVLLVTLPLDDVEENAAMVNAIQRRATVITQKSLAEGFGLTVAEGMWKGRPVVGSAVGGIVDQIAGGTGILLPDPRDLAAFGADVRWLLEHPQDAERMGAAGMAYTREHFVGDLHLIRFAEVIDALIAD
jgi:trehalose synthase